MPAGKLSVSPCKFQLQSIIAIKEEKSSNSLLFTVTIHGLAQNGFPSKYIILTLYNIY